MSEKRTDNSIIGEFFKNAFRYSKSTQNNQKTNEEEISTASQSTTTTSNESGGTSKSLVHAEAVNPLSPACDRSSEFVNPNAEATGQQHAIQHSRGESCGVCLEKMMEKSLPKQMYGILPNCNHCFCLTCMKKWRKTKQLTNRIIVCPVCCVTSDFIYPSIYWVDAKEKKEKKEKLIRNYKILKSKKQCIYLKRGPRNCPYGNKCLYSHVSPLNNRYRFCTGSLHCYYDPKVFAPYVKVQSTSEKLEQYHSSDSEEESS